MGEIINPYIAGAPVAETRMFFGREDVFEWIQNSLVGQYADHILVIHGQRRVGKTSVLKQLGNRLPEHYIPVFFDLQGRTHTNLDRFLWWLGREIVHVLKQERNIEIALPEKETFAQDAEYFENHFLPGLQPAIGDHTLLLTFDEFDNLEENEIKESLARPLVDYLRRLMGREGLNFIFSIGSSGRKLENMQAAYTEFFKTALYKKISFLSEEQTHALIKQPVTGVLEYDREAVDLIYRITSGHPYFTQLTCHELFARCQRTEQRKITRSDVEAILDDVVERGTVNLKFVWDEASDIEKWGLASLAHIEEKADTPEVVDFLHKQRVRFSESDLNSGILHLREKDVLYPDNRFVIYLLRLWLQKNRPVEQVREELTEVNPIANRYIESGLEFKNAGTFDKATESFLSALAVDADNVQAQVNIGLVYMDQKAYDKAIVEFEKATTIDDEDVTSRSGLCEAHLSLGDAALQKGRTKDAIRSYQRVLAINVEHTEARGRMAEIQRQRAEKALVDGRDDEAIAAFVEGLKFTPEDKALAQRYEQAKIDRRTKVLAGMFARAEKEQSSGKWDGALSILNQADKIDPGNEKIQKLEATVRAEQNQLKLDTIVSRAERARAAGRWCQVIAALSEYLLLEPDDKIIQEELEDARKKLMETRLEEARGRANNLARQEHFDEALAIWEEMLKSSPREQTSILAEVEKIQQVQAQAKEELHKQQLNSLLVRADRANGTGRWELVVAVLEEYLSFEPRDEAIKKRLEEAHRKQTETQVKEIQNKARSLSRQERFEEAQAAWQELLKIAPAQAQAVQAEIDKLHPARELAKAYAEAQQAFTEKNYDHAVNLFKGIIIQDENYKDASRLLAQAIELRCTRRRWWQSKVLWGSIAIVLVVVLAWFAFRSSSPLAGALFAPPPAPTRVEVTATSTASTGTEASASIATPAGTEVASSTVTATATPSSSADQINTFAQPILAAIANFSPDYTDDFSNPNSGWPSGTVQTDPNGVGIADRGYINGEYFLRASFLPSSQCCLDSNGGPKLPPHFADFVMTVDFRFISGDAGSVCFDSRRIWGGNPEPDSYSICFSLDGSFNIFRVTPHKGINLANGFAPTLSTGTAPNHLKIVARGSQMAYFLNDQPLELVYDDVVKSGAFGFWLESDTSTPLEIRYDNLKVWEIASLSLFEGTSTTSDAQIRAFSDPILAAVTGRLPDVADDFSDPNSGWPIGSTSNGDKWGYAGGMYTLTVTNLYRNPTGDPCLDISPKTQPQFSDFVEEWDVQFVTGLTGSWHSIFRETASNLPEKISEQYFSGFSLAGNFFLDKNLNANGKLEQVNIADGLAIPSFLQGAGKNKVTIIAQGTKIAIYINGAPMVLATDPTWQAGRISLEFGACNNTNSPLEVRFDNLKVWAIAPIR